MAPSLDEPVIKMLFQNSQAVALRNQGVCGGGKPFAEPFLAGGCALRPAGSGERNACDTSLRTSPRGLLLQRQPSASGEVLSLRKEEGRRSLHNRVRGCTGFSASRRAQGTRTSVSRCVGKGAAFCFCSHGPRKCVSEPTSPPVSRCARRLPSTSSRLLRAVLEGTSRKQTTEKLREAGWGDCTRLSCLPPVADRINVPFSPKVTEDRHRGVWPAPPPRCACWRPMDFAFDRHRAGT